MMTDRESALRKLAVGDIFHGRSSNGASLVCLVTAVDDGTIYARRIHTQDDLKFDRTTGFECGKEHTKIDCATPFPPDIHKIFLEMDRKYGEHTELFRKGLEPEPEQRKLTTEERRANLSINAHVAANPI
ncbi:MAG TPA: hypothetical protein VME45_14805 [Stellaceae bacterium]|nr:hypothetical protein [Stellaceae bacterium]